MKNWIKKALKLSCFPSILGACFLPLVNNSTASIMCSTNFNEEIGTADASLFVSGDNVSGTVYYQIDKDEKVNAINICNNQDYEPSVINGKNITFKDQVIIDETSYYLTSIEDYALSYVDGNNGISGSVTFNKHLSNLGQYAFNGQKVNKYAFDKDSNLTVLSNGCFADNNNLSEVEISDNYHINSIGTKDEGESEVLGAFENCSNLKIFHFPRATQFIAKNAFIGCKLTDIYFSCEVLKDINTLVVQDNTFKSFKNLKVHIPKGTTGLYKQRLEKALNDSAIIIEDYKPDPLPKSNKLTTGQIIGIVLGCILIPASVSVSIAVPLIKKRKNKNNSKYKKPIEKEDQAKAKYALNKKYQIGKLIGRKCPRCGSPLICRLNKKKNRKFIGCVNYPKCTYTEEIDSELE